MEHEKGMMDMGMKSNLMEAKSSKEKNKIYYPSATVDKDMGMKMGQKVIMEGVVSGLRKDKHGDSTTFEIRGCKPMNNDTKSEKASYMM